MRKVLLMAKRDYVESVRTKAFILGLIVAPPALYALRKLIRRMRSLLKKAPFELKKEDLP